MNFALAHVLGATLQTAMFNAPLVVIVGWGLKKQMVSNLSHTSSKTLGLIFTGSKFSDLRCRSFDSCYYCSRQLSTGQEIQLPGGCTLRLGVSYHSW